MLANVGCQLAFDLQDPDLNFEEDEQADRQAVSSLQVYVPFRSFRSFRCFRIYRDIPFGHCMI